MSRKQRIEQILKTSLLPEFFHVEDESKNHHVPKGAQTHFKVIAVSSQFMTLTPIARHRKVNELLKEEFNTGLHALSMHLYTPKEWETKSRSILQSPACKGGYKNT